MTREMVPPMAASMKVVAKAAERDAAARNGGGGGRGGDTLPATFLRAYERLLRAGRQGESDGGGAGGVGGVTGRGAGGSGTLRSPLERLHDAGFGGGGPGKHGRVSVGSGGVDLAAVEKVARVKKMIDWRLRDLGAEIMMRLGEIEIEWQDKGGAGGVVVGGMRKGESDKLDEARDAEALMDTRCRSCGRAQAQGHRWCPWCGRARVRMVAELDEEVRKGIVELSWRVSWNAGEEMDRDTEGRIVGEIMAEAMKACDSVKARNRLLRKQRTRKAAGR